MASSKSYWSLRRDVACSIDILDDVEIMDDVEGGLEGDVCTEDNLVVVVDDMDVVDSHPEASETVCDTESLFSCTSDLFESESCEGDLDSSSVSSVDDDISDDNLSQALAEWVRQHNISSSAVNSLLHILHTYHPSLPLEYRTLLGTVRTVAVRDLSNGGQYSHIGISRNLQQIFDTNSEESCFNCNDLNIQFNVDGLPVFKSSNMQLWPILGILKGMSCEKPFTIGIYCGIQKPSNVDEYLSEFVNELKQLQEEGIVLGDRRYFVSVHSFVCDAPARALLKQTKLHSGYNACERCVQKGQWLGRVVYPKTDAPLRTDVAFDELSDEPHHHGPSPLHGLGIGLVSLFCLDYMHLVCLGIMRKLLIMLMRGPLEYRLSAGIIQQISQRLINLRSAIPCEFARKPRTLFEIDRWKATELRQFLLYTGPVVLKGLLTETLYKHFMLFSFSIYCCVHSDLCARYSEFARAALTKFVTLAAKIYGEDVLVYNMHTLVHIVDDVKLFGALDNISCFPFENHLRCMKKLVRRPGMPLQQVVCRLSELAANGKQLTLAKAPNTLTSSATQ